MQEETKKFLPVIIFLVVIIGVGILIFLLSDSQASSDGKGDTPQISNSTQNSDPIENIDQKWSKGNPNAKIKIIEYSDFQCPYCEKGAETMEAVYEKYKDQVNITFSHFPLTNIHPNAIPASIAAEAAGYQGKFWEMHDLLFANQDNLSKEDFISYANKLGLDIDMFEKYLNNTNIEDKVKSQQTEIAGQEFDEIALDEKGNIIVKGKASVTGTPAFLINGKLVVGAYPADQFEKFIESALKDK